MNREREIDISERLAAIKSVKRDLVLAQAFLDNAFETICDAEEVMSSYLTPQKPHKRRAAHPYIRAVR